MQKFVVRKSTRGAIVTINEEDSCDTKPNQRNRKENFGNFKKEFSASDSQLAKKQEKNVKMCGYLKKKRNVRNFLLRFSWSKNVYS